MRQLDLRKMSAFYVFILKEEKETPSASQENQDKTDDDERWRLWDNMLGVHAICRAIHLKLHPFQSSRIHRMRRSSIWIILLEISEYFVEYLINGSVSHWFCGQRG